MTIPKVSPEVASYFPMIKLIFGALVSLGVVYLAHLFSHWRERAQIARQRADREEDITREREWRREDLAREAEADRLKLCREAFSSIRALLESAQAEAVYLGEPSRLLADVDEARRLGASAPTRRTEGLTQLIAAVAQADVLLPPLSPSLRAMAQAQNQLNHLCHMEKLAQLAEYDKAVAAQSLAKFARERGRLMAATGKAHTEFHAVAKRLVATGFADLSEPVRDAGPYASIIEVFTRGGARVESPPKT